MNAQARLFFSLGAMLALLAVAAGAFGAHGLRARIGPDLLAVFETGARYQMYHALGLFVVAWAGSQRPGMLVSVAGGLFVTGIVLFSGSLYAMTFTGVRALGAITPVGGLAFLAGWGCLAAWALWQRPRSRTADIRSPR
jgi:uncharacterized membrane protein YgdD (TMEM256/DUF423 family)